MATKYLSATANLSAAVWWTTAGGTTVTTAPGIGDDADLNGRTLTVDQAFTCDAIVGSGTLAMSGNRTITANLGSASSSWTFTIAASQTATTIGNLIGGSAGTRWSVTSISSTWNHTGSVTGSATSNVSTVSQTQASSTINIVGNVKGGTNTNNNAISNTSGVCNITGTLTGGSGVNCSGVLLTNGTVNLTGNLVDAGSSAIRKGSGTFNYTPTASHTATIGGKVLYPTSGIPDIFSSSQLRTA